MIRSGVMPWGSPMVALLPPFAVVELPMSVEMLEPVTVLLVGGALTFRESVRAIAVLRRCSSGLMGGS
eukprot:CAMPEP_0176021078 /NCGR_PEP_ID=MMETSP0120_2-20121206/10227_1 /TAXON_ID=160619 /ORGANISM="Kryptoperidinium foliaceum, Strain CCMP 1326" /LENGTH=67 /DNA_ID=CAMNT_0017354187 /DNA_START=17 /DNA_END=220 /DNA_ORIENTATION=-